ncbi:MAG: FKBP-type peptidyl-prolyl cis-trans isomerase [Candidatus Omnitrophica bacterium]|nr:FKBP-type peptidyl-prolyl cis-trans isomerase [Candidatus Omnitrophota bacterium]
MIKKLFASFLMGFVFLSATGFAIAEEAIVAKPGIEKEVVRKGDKVKLDSKLYIGGELLDSTPVDAVLKKGKILPALENALLGMKVGEAKTIILKPEEAYGKVEPTNIIEVPKDMKVFKDVSLVVGGSLDYKFPTSGKYLPCRIKEIKNSTVVLDFNSPHAGKDVKWDIVVVSINH